MIRPFLKLPISLFHTYAEGDAGFPIPIRARSLPFISLNLDTADIPK